MADRKATVRVEGEGHDKVSQDEQRLAEALKGTGQAAEQRAPQMKSGAQAADDAAEATDKLNLSEQQLKDTLGAIHPAFNELFDAMKAGTEVASQLGTKNIDLDGTIQQVTEHVVNNASAYKLLGAAGAAAAALAFLAHQWGEVQERIKGAREEVARFAEAQTDAAGKARADRDAMADALAAAGKTGEDNLSRAMTYADQLRRAGLGGVATQTAADLAGSGASQGQALAYGAASDLGMVEPDMGLADFDAKMQEEAYRQIVLSHVQFRSQEANRRREEAFRQMDAFTVSRGGIFGGAEIAATGASDLALDTIARSYGVSDEEARQVLESARKRFHDQQVIDAARRRGQPQVSASRLFGDDADTYTGPGGELIELTARLEGIAQALTERMSREDRAGVPGGPAVIEQYVARQTNYNSAAGPRGGRNGQNRRDRRGRG